MEKIGVGILGAAEIAKNRFLPALLKCENAKYIGLASHSRNKAVLIQKEFGGKIFEQYEEIIENSNVQIVYIALPPSLHFEWGKRAIEAGKHVFMEKPFTTTPEDTKVLIESAKKKKLVVYENYMYKHHSQLLNFRNKIEENCIGKIYEYTIRFAFPMRDLNDFRYNKSLGGGALLDCGGYTVHLARTLLGKNIKILSSHLVLKEKDGVDIFGAAFLVNEKGIVANIAFGMDHSYKCEVEAWGSQGCLRATRIFTAPVGFQPSLLINKDGKQVIEIQPEDNQFLNSINYFMRCLEESKLRERVYNDIQEQADMVFDIKKRATDNWK